MAEIQIEVNGVSYPCKPTMGAMLRYKKETGEEATEIRPDNFSGLCTFLYCCVASASAAAKIPFGMTLMEFADSLDPEAMRPWAESLQQANQSAVEDEKKSVAN